MYSVAPITARSVSIAGARPTTRCWGSPRFPTTTRSHPHRRVRRRGGQPSRRADSSTPDTLHAGAAAEFGPVEVVERGAALPDLGADRHATRGWSAASMIRHFDAPRLRALDGHFAADEPRPDHHHMAGAVESPTGWLSESSRVRITWTPGMPSVPGESPGTGTCGYHRCVVSELLAGGEGDGAFLPVQAHRRRAEFQLDALFVEEVRRTEVRILRSLLPVRTSLDCGGRSYGKWGSSPTRMIRPANRRRRKACAVRKPPRDAPTITTDRESGAGWLTRWERVRSCRPRTPGASDGRGPCRGRPP